MSKTDAFKHKKLNELTEHERCIFLYTITGQCMSKDYTVEEIFNFFDDKVILPITFEELEDLIFSNSQEELFNELDDIALIPKDYS